MSAVASRPTSIANSFYESEGRPSMDHARLVDSNGSKTTGLVRAIGREREGLVPSFRPPSSWTQRSSHYDVVWTGELDGNDDQFSDAESWDGDTPPASNGANNADVDATASVYGHVRPNSIASSIFAGRGARSEHRRRQAPPPLPTLPHSHRLQQGNHLLGSDAPPLLSPRSDASGFETSSQYSDFDGKPNPTVRVDLADGFDIQRISPSKPSSRQPSQDQDEDAVTHSVPSRNSSKAKPPLPAKAASRGSHESPRRDGSSSSDADNSPTRASIVSRSSPNRLPDGTIIPKMPPVPQTSDLVRSLKPKARRDRSPILSFDGGVAEEEKLLGQLQGQLADDARRISTLGPKVKKNAPAPWELGGEDTATATGRPSLRDTLRPSAETFEKPFSRFKSRPSVDDVHSAPRSPNPRSPNPVHVPSGLAPSSRPSNAASLEAEAQKEDDAQSLFATQRSRSKSVSSSAVGMLKGLGLAAAAAPASKKGKLTKALRLVGGGGGAANDERRSAQSAPAPLSELLTSAKVNHAGSSPIAPVGGFANEMPHSHSARNINGGATTPSAMGKSQADLVNMLMSSNVKYRDQARSLPIPPPQPANAPLSSPRLGGVRSLAYKKDTLSANDTTSFASEQSLTSMERARSRTPPARQVSVASRSATSTEDTAPRSSSIMGEETIDSIPAEGESTPVGKFSAEALASRARPTSPSGHQAGMMSTSSSQTSGSLPLPGNIEGVPYKLISLEQAREQARQKQSEWLASSGAAGATNKTSPYLASGDAAHDEVGMSREPSSDGQSSLRLLKNKKSGFLLRKLKKEKGVSVDFDGVSTFPQSGSNRDLARSSKSPMPSFSVTGLDEENDELKPLGSFDKPALQIRPVSSMFSGFAADFLDASTIAEGHVRETSSSSSIGSTGLLAPRSPVSQSFRTPSPVLSETGHCTSSSSSNKPKLAEIRPPPHGATVPGPIVPGSADSNWSGHGGASGTSRLPSLDAGASNSDTQSQFHSPATSPLTPSFHHHSIHGQASSQTATTPLIEETTALSPPASPQIPEEVGQRAREIEAQIQELCNELTELRVKHVGQGTAPTFVEDAEQRKEHKAVGDCPYCGCGCAEQRRLQSINEAAVLKGIISVLDRGRALKPSSNMGSTGKFGGYTNR